MRLHELLSEANFTQPDWLTDNMMSNITKYNPGNESQIIDAILNVSNTKGLSPAAIAGVIDTESKFNSGANNNNNFRGAFQMGRPVFNDNGGVLGGMTYDEYSNADLATQINHFPSYLDNYNFDSKLPDLGSYEPAMQAAALQGFQFGPNAVKTWMTPFLAGDTSRPTTPHAQASALGNASLDDMSSYFTTIIGDGGSGSPMPSNNQFASLAGSSNTMTDFSTQAAGTLDPKPASFTPPPTVAPIEPPGTSINPDMFSSGQLAKVGTSNYNMRQGSSGTNVSSLQRSLQSMGYDIGDTGADGKYGSKTAAAVKQFQTDRGLQVDSIAGDQTMSTVNDINMNSRIANANKVAGASKIPAAGALDTPSVTTSPTIAKAGAIAATPPGYNAPGSSIGSDSSAPATSLRPKAIPLGSVDSPAGAAATTATPPDMAANLALGIVGTKTNADGTTKYIGKPGLGLSGYDDAPLRALRTGSGTPKIPAAGALDTPSVTTSPTTAKAGAIAATPPGYNAPATPMATTSPPPVTPSTISAPVMPTPKPDTKGVTPAPMGPVLQDPALSAPASSPSLARATSPNKPNLINALSNVVKKA